MTSLSPAAPASNTLPTTLDTHTGARPTLQSGGGTRDNTVQLSGTLVPGSVVSIHDGLHLLGTATVYAGLWSFDTPELSDGRHLLSALIANAAGNARRRQSRLPGRAQLPATWPRTWAWLILNPAVGRLLALQTLDESNTCAHDDLHLMGESAAQPQVCRFRPLALLLAPPGQAVRGALAPSLKTCFVSPQSAPNCRIEDDLRIFVSLRSLDGPGGTSAEAAPDAFGPGGGLPYSGTVNFDSSDINAFLAAGTLDDLAMHEMGHMLVFMGPILSQRGLLDPGKAVRYTGANALSNYQKLTGSTASFIPLEQGRGPGPAGNRWDGSVLA